MEESKKVQRKAAYSILDRGEGKEPYWHLIGTAFVCKDGSLNLVLNSLPLDGKVHIRDFKERDAQ